MFPATFSSGFFMYNYRPQRSWGRVIFSEAFVKNSVHMGRRAWQGAVHGRGACMAGGMHGKGACVTGGACMAGGRVWLGGVLARYYEIRSMSGRYASYWNAYLS